MDATITASGKGCPFVGWNRSSRLWSLHDMIDVLPWQFWGLVHQVTAPLLVGEPSNRKANGTIESGAIGTILRAECEPLLSAWGCPISADLLSRIVFKLTNPREEYLDAACVADFESLRETIRGELGRRRFAYIPPPYDEYFEQERLFGDDVYALFPDTRGDTKNAGNCLAAGLGTASVFYSM